MGGESSTERKAHLFGMVDEYSIKNLPSSTEQIYMSACNFQRFQLVNTLLQLKELHIEKSYIGNVRPITLIPLKCLQLNDCFLGGDSAKRISCMSTLQSLNLNDNSIGNEGIAHVMKLSGIVQLRLQSCGADYIDLKRMPNWKNVRVLKLGNKKLIQLDSNQKIEKVAACTNGRKDFVMGYYV